VVVVDLVAGVGGGPPTGSGGGGASMWRLRRRGRRRRRGADDPTIIGSPAGGKVAVPGGAWCAEMMSHGRWGDDIVWDGGNEGKKMTSNIGTLFERK